MLAIIRAKLLPGAPLAPESAVAIDVAPSHVAEGAPDAKSTSPLHSEAAGAPGVAEESLPSTLGTAEAVVQAARLSQVESNSTP